MSYVIAGRAIKNEYLALGTLLSTAAIAFAARGSGNKKEGSAPNGGVTVGTTQEQIKAGSSEEEEFIRNFVAEAEKSDKQH